jgi:Tfp pilus assembly protein PilN
MRALCLDFVRARRPASLVGLALFAAGALTCGAIAVEALDARDEVERLALQSAQAERRVRAQRAVSAPAAAPTPDEARAMREANQVIGRLTVPWPRLLGETAAAAGGAVALTGLNPDTQGRSVRIAGVAPDLAAVYAFVERMQALPGFVQVHLAQHEVARETSAGPRVGFVVVAHWSGAS